jgi:hypothetical protein
VIAKLKRWLTELWLKANFEWAKAGEIQKRIDDTRAEQFAKYDRIRWHI